MQRFHRPTDEKRSVVFLHPQQYDDWLDASVRSASEFLHLFPAAELVGFPAPRAEITSVEKKDGKDRADELSGPAQAGMFD